MMKGWWGGRSPLFGRSGLHQRDFDENRLVAGGAGALPGDVIFSAADCAGWSVPWAAPGGCIGSGEASVLRAAPSGFLYEVIEVADKELGCETGWDSQWWPLGLVRSAGWAPSTQWEQMRETPFVGGPAGGDDAIITSSTPK